MSKATNKKKNAAHTTDDTRLTLMNESANVQRSKKTSFLLSDTFLTILLGLVALLFILIIVLAVLFGFQNSTHVPSFVKQIRNLTNENNTQTVEVFISTTPLPSVESSENDTMTVYGVTPKLQHNLPRGTHIELGFVEASED
ncbi:unnamed protein product [Adineta ricciae]|uniref:Uncharacterized protein n=1 Tax=Adineta ricciae TaxID=249248 RepID=A0A815I8K8_ADIRI|nr:unnamed protein product [Adineta ricciae]CAF1678649.1 unnamed protein product [Adineta ricciae]